MVTASINTFQSVTPFQETLDQSEYELTSCNSSLLYVFFTYEVKIIV